MRRLLRQGGTGDIGCGVVVETVTYTVCLVDAPQFLLQTRFGQRRAPTPRPEQRPHLPSSDDIPSSFLDTASSMCI